jgi:hypothetical protein
VSTSGNDRFPFESPEQRTLDQVRRDGTTPSVSGYQTDLGEIFPVPGDQTAPYGHVLGRASSTGTTPNTVEDEEPQRLLVDQFGRVIVVSPGGAPSLAALVSPNPIPDATTTVYSVLSATVGNATGQLVIKASPGRLRRVLIANNDAVQRYAMVFNAAAVGAIATGTMLTPGLPIPAGGFGFFDFSEADLACTTGIAVALSSTQTTYTAVGVTGQFSGQFA